MTFIYSLCDGDRLKLMRCKRKTKKQCVEIVRRLAKEFLSDVSSGSFSCYFRDKTVYYEVLRREKKNFTLPISWRERKNHKKRPWFKRGKDRRFCGQSYHIYNEALDFIREEKSQ